MHVRAGQTSAQLRCLRERNKRSVQIPLFYCLLQLCFAIAADAESNFDLTRQCLRQIENLLVAVSQAEITGVEQGQPDLAEHAFALFRIGRKRQLGLVNSPGNQRLPPCRGVVSRQQPAHAGTEVRNQAASAIRGPEQTVEKTGGKAPCIDQTLRDCGFGIEVETPVHNLCTRMEELPYARHEDAENWVGSDHDNIWRAASKREQTPPHDHPKRIQNASAAGGLTEFWPPDAPHQNLLPLLRRFKTR